ncbi:RNA-binding domain-containing protein [Metschnikowia bicuspidata]|uniref:RNA-binding domain-containing protein n=1 Tax=Metschnikowia bicuspidata TaxID=27322 RepID=A0A4P9ZEE4_9ASCO|nr:RNA-binding domain-containing protein [Metschnikowia bicuspidata]
MTYAPDGFVPMEQKRQSLLPAISPTVVSSTASQQHQHEQEMLLLFAVPEPPISTKELTFASDQNKSLDSAPINSPRTLWMGDLDPWLDQAAIEDLWRKILNKHVSVKLIKPKMVKLEPDFMGQTHSGYCFVEFDLFEDAQEALALNGKLLPDIAIPSQLNGMNDPNNQKKYFRLNWASGATLTAPIVDSPEYSLFVGDLSALTTEAHLLLFFQKVFPDSVRTVRVMTDPMTGKSRCFGFVRFTDDQERQRALVEMNGAWFGGRPLRVALATSRNSSSRRNHEFKQLPPMGYMGSPMGPVLGPTAPYDTNMTGPMNFSVPPSGDSLIGPRMCASPQEYMYMSQIPQQSMSYPVNMDTQYADPTNTTVFVGGLLHEVNVHALFSIFKHFGQIIRIKIPPGKNCGFIKFNTREEAEEAILVLEGYVIGGHRVRLGWGRVSASNKQFCQRQMQAQMQAAAAMSIGMNPASAYAAAAAGFATLPPASQGYPPMPMQLPPQMPGMMADNDLGAGEYNREEEDANSDSLTGYDPQQKQPDDIVSGFDNLSMGSKKGRSMYAPFEMEGCEDVHNKHPSSNTPSTGTDKSNGEAEPAKDKPKELDAGLEPAETEAKL